MAETCACERENGVCLSCRNMHLEAVRAHLRGSLRMIDLLDATCESCQKADVDFVMATIVQEILMSDGPKRKEFLMGVIDAFKKTTNLKATPIVDRTLAVLGRL